MSTQVWSTKQLTHELTQRLIDDEYAYERFYHYAAFLNYIVSTPTKAERDHAFSSTILKIERGDDFSNRDAQTFLVLLKATNSTYLIHGIKSVEELESRYKIWKEWLFSKGAYLTPGLTAPVYLLDETQDLPPEQIKKFKDYLELPRLIQNHKTPFPDWPQNFTPPLPDWMLLLS